MIGWILVSLACGECIVSDDIYADTERKKVASSVCKEVLGSDHTLLSFTNYTTKVEGSGQWGYSASLFYGSDSFSVDFDEHTRLGGDWRGLEVFIGLEAGETGTVTLVRNQSSYGTMTGDPITLEILDSVSAVHIQNNYPGRENELYVSSFTYHGTGSITATDAKPIIQASRIIMSESLVRHHNEGSVQLIASEFMFVVDESTMITGKMSPLIRSYGYPSTVAENDLGNGWTLVENEATSSLDVVFIMKVDATVTLGKYSCNVSTQSGTFILYMTDQFGKVVFDLQNNVTIDFYCENDVERTELLGGKLTHKTYQLPGTSSGPTPTEHGGFLFHGTWPYVADLVGESMLMKRTTTRNLANKTVTRTTYWGKREPMFEYDPSSAPLKLVGQNTPVYFREGLSEKHIILGAPDVGIQIDMDKSCTITMCEDQRCVLHVKGQVPDSFPEIEGNVSDLEVIAHTCTSFEKTDFALSCERIDVRQVPTSSVENLTLTDGGTIYVSYTYPNTFPELSEAWETYAGTQTWLEGGNSSALWNDWTNTLGWINNNLGKFSAAFKQDVLNRFTGVLQHVKVGKNATISVARQDVIPFAAFYSKDPQAIICLERDPVVEDWSLSVSNALPAINNGSLIFGKYGPSFSDFELPGSLAQMKDDKKCIGMRAEQPPRSSASVVVYTSNETYITLLSAFPDYVTVVTPDNISSSVTLTHPNCTNVVVLCLDSVPDGTSIQLSSLQSDANLFVFGIPLNALDIVFQIVALAYDSKKDTEEYYSSVKKLIEPLVSKYPSYFPNVSIATNRVGCILLAGTNYMGTTIDSEHFYALGCRFQDGLSVKATHTNADTYSYGTLKDVVLNDVVLFPIATDTPDHISITDIVFGKDQVTMSGSSGYYQFLGEQTKKFELTVNTANIRGQLYILSFSDSLTLTLAESTGTKVKGVKAIMNGGFKTETFDLPNFLPTSPLLWSDTDSDGEQFNILSLFSSLPSLFANTNTRNLTSVKFVGNWDQVEEIEGHFGVNAGDTILHIDNVPANVLRKFGVEQAFTTSVTVSGQPTEVHLGTQVISGLRELNLELDPSVKVTFENLTFARGFPGATRESSFAVMATYEELDELVANHVKCGDYSHAVLGRLSVRQSLEMGLVSVLTTTEIQADNIDLKLHYNFALGFPQAPEAISPKAIKLVYDGDDATTDVESYRTKPLTIRKLADQKTCSSWKSKVSYESTNPDFSGRRSRVTASCENENLILILGDVKQDKPNIGAIVGGVLGALAVVAIVAVVVFVVLKKRSRTLEFSDSSASPDTEVL